MDTKERNALTVRKLANEFAGLPCTLNGKPAKVTGRLCPFAIISPLDASLPTVEFSWFAVMQVMRNNEGRFKS